MLSHHEFSILNELVNHGYTTQRELAKKIGVSVGSINRILKLLTEQKRINEDMTPLESAYEALAPYKVSNAVIMAAGMSSRFAPLSYEKPKGLMIVKDEILIEREIEQLKAAGISDITIVVGYMKEKLFYLQDKYDVEIRVNEDYYRYNNTSTLMKVLDRLDNTYICSSDNYFVQNVFTPYVYQSYYSAQYQEGKTDEYCLTTQSNGLIKSVSIGGEDAWYMIGHVYFDRSLSMKFKEILIKEYERLQTKEELWENLYMRYIKELPLFIKKYPAGIIQEFDSLDDLRRFDSHYIKNTDSSIMKNICTVLKCEEEDISDIIPIKQGLTNTSFNFACKGERFVYRHPGVGTEKFIHRDSEAFSMDVAKDLGLDDTFIYMDRHTGWKISHYITDCRTLNYRNMDEVKQALELMKRLHDANITSKYDFNIWKGTQEFIHQIETLGRADFEDFDELYALMSEVYEFTEKDNIPKRLCHCDCYDPNFLIDTEGKMYLIDWEYSGNDDPANDLGTFICCSDYNYEEAIEVLEMYAGKKLEIEELRHYLGYISIASYYWFVWAIYQESVGNTVGEYLYLWYKGSKFYAEKALELYKK